MPDVTFFSDQFSQTPRSDAINDMLGHDLAEWLRAGLAEAGFDVGEVIAEDYGYGLWVNLDGSHYWVMTTEYEPAGYEGQTQPKWLIGLHYDPGCLYVWRLRRRPDAEAVPRIAQAVHTLLASETAVSGIEWWAQDVGRGTAMTSPPAT